MIRLISGDEVELTDSLVESCFGRPLSVVATISKITPKTARVVYGVSFSSEGVIQVNKMIDWAIACK